MREYFMSLLLGLIILAIFVIFSQGILVAAISSDIENTVELNNGADNLDNDSMGSSIGNEIFIIGNDANRRSEMTEEDVVDDAGENMDHDIDGIENSDNQKVENNIIQDSGDQDAIQDAIDDEFGQVIEEFPIIDSGYPSIPLERDIYAIRHHLDTLFYGILPLSICLLVGFLILYWFYKTFIDVL